jgi:hypothetical protein
MASEWVAWITPVFGCEGTRQELRWERQYTLYDDNHDILTTTESSRQ